MSNPSRVLKASIFASVMFIGVQASAEWVAQGPKLASFTAKGPGGLSIVGTTADVSVKAQGDNLAITVGLARLKTGIDMRDKHMTEKYLETPKYPTAVLVVPQSNLKVPVGGTDVKGKLTLHGRTKDVLVHYEASGSPKSASIKGTLRINMQEFGIEVPDYLGVTVKPAVDIAVKFDAVDK